MFKSFEHGVMDELNDVAKRKPDVAIEDNTENLPQDETDTANDKDIMTINEIHQQDSGVIDRKCTNENKAFVLSLNASDPNAFAGNTTEKDDCIHSPEESACLQTFKEDAPFLDDIYTRENATMDNMDILVAPMSAGYSLDANTTYHQSCKSKSDKESDILREVSFRGNTFCVCKGRGQDLNTCSISTASSAEASENTTVEEMHPHADGGCVCDSDCFPDKMDESKGEAGSLPLLDQLCENELEDTDTQVSYPGSKIPNFEILLQGISETGRKMSLAFGEIEDDTNVIDLLKELRDELISKEDTDDFGLALLFEDTKLKQSSNRVKSKAAKKRKKQLQKIQTFAGNHKSENRQRKFAQTFQELQISRPMFEEHDVGITCPVCLEMYHRPSTCIPCGHMFCDPCLRRLTSQGSEGIPCPLCRTVIYSCDLSKDLDEYLILTHPDTYKARAQSERHSKFRHYQLPYTAPVPLGKRILRQMIASRNNQSDSRWMSHDWFKFLLGCTVGMCLSLLLMLFNRVKSVRDARDVNIVFLSVLIGIFVTFLIFKFIKI